MGENRPYDLGQRLRDLRKSKQMTQKQVAERLHISASAVSGYEGNIKTPSVDMLVELARLYNVSTDYLLGVDNRAVVSVEGLTARQVSLIEGTIEGFIRNNPV